MKHHHPPNTPPQIRPVALLAILSFAVLLRGLLGGSGMDNFIRASYFAVAAVIVGGLLARPTKRFEPL